MLAFVASVGCMLLAVLAVIIGLLFHAVVAYTVAKVLFVLAIAIIIIKIIVALFRWLC